MTKVFLEVCKNYIKMNKTSYFHQFITFIYQSWKIIFLYLMFMIAVNRVAMSTRFESNLKVGKYLNNKLIFALPILAVLLFATFQRIKQAASHVGPTLSAGGNLNIL